MSGKRGHVLQLLREALVDAPPTGRLAVAFSGGVDSTLLLALAREAVGDRVLAVTAHSESLAARELEACQRLAAQLEVPLILVRTRELDRPDYRANSSDRCYHCKTELFERLGDELVEREGIAAVAYGATADDLGDHRPGMRAASEHQILKPLADAELGKDEIRALSRELGLETWDKPAQPCLASRIPYGQAVSAEKLARIDGAEALLKDEGFRELRVRHHSQPGGDMARIELPLDELPRLLEADRRQRVVAGLRALGFHYVSLDLEGFRSGRLNEVLTERRLPLALS